MAVAGLKLIAGDQEGRVGSMLGLVTVRIQRHLLFTGRHLLYWAADILKKKKKI